MTGFGRGTTNGESFTITAELKTVNNRYLDIPLKLPGELQSLENVIKHTITDRIARGRVDVNLQYERTTAVNYELNRPVISGFLSAMKEMQDEFGLAGEPDLNVVARLPNVLIPKKDDIDDGFRSGVVAAVNAAVDDLEKMRGNEGRMLKDELTMRLAEIEKRLGPIVEQSASIGDEYQQKLTKRISEMLAKSETQLELDQARLAQEVAYIADRSDISEEIARLTTHIEHFRSIMDEEKEVGKRLDFLTQELNREANTITSKTSNMIVKENALEIKSEIEKIREQVQNIE